MKWVLIGAQILTLTMAFHVLVSVVSAEEHLLTERTLEGAVVLACVSLVMTIQVLFTSEGLATLCTGVRLFPCVGHLMASQVMTVE